MSCRAPSSQAAFELTTRLTEITGPILPNTPNEFEIRPDGFRIGTMPATDFHSWVSHDATVSDSRIVGISWWSSLKRPFHHQYCIANVQYGERIYDVRMERLGKLDKTWGKGGTAKDQVTITDSEPLTGITDSDLILALLEKSNPLCTFDVGGLRPRGVVRWGTLMHLDDQDRNARRSPPTLLDLAVYMSTIHGEAPLYNIRNHNCYFLARMMMLLCGSRHFTFERMIFRGGPMSERHLRLPPIAPTEHGSNMGALLSMLFTALAKWRRTIALGTRGDPIQGSEPHLCLPPTALPEGEWNVGGAGFMLFMVLVEWRERTEGSRPDALASVTLLGIGIALCAVPSFISAPIPTFFHHLSTKITGIVLLFVGCGFVSMGIWRLIRQVYAQHQLRQRKSSILARLGPLSAPNPLPALEPHFPYFCTGFVPLHWCSPSLQVSSSARANVEHMRELHQLDISHPRYFDDIRDLLSRLWLQEPFPVDA